MQAAARRRQNLPGPAGFKAIATPHAARSIPINTPTSMRSLLLLLPLALLAACQPSEPPATPTATPEARPVAATTARATSPVVVYKTPTCGCCKMWVDHLRGAGFEVETRDLPNLSAVKDSLGVPGTLASCHTAVVDGYVVEGHVPAGEISRLLEERPDVVGISVPGMPVGSPGMEVPGRAPQTYDVMSFGTDGVQRFATYTGAARQSR